ncbi:MAG: hypothetical protein EOO52_08305 [Gammaproteobacteria bacterium]|nr:MAG: hypothetical protein EOO52_08305 [Gammaproteobacteria bacterium]
MKLVSIIISLSIIFISSIASARDAARDLRRMVGYTIISSQTVDSIIEGKFGAKLLKLSDGSVFKVDLLLDPLSFTDVIVFAKAPSKELIAQYKGKLPEYMMYSYKLLIDNEIYDANPN